MLRRSSVWVALVFPILATAAAAQDSWTRIMAELPAELASQEEELQKKKSQEAVPEEPALSNRFTLRGGVLLEAITFNAITSIGSRTLSPGPMALARIEWAGDVGGSLFLQASLEFADRKDVQGFSGELDLGIHLLSTELCSCRFELDAEAGLMVSKVWVTTPGFGSFDLGWGLRAGLDSHLWLLKGLSLDASIDFRVISYPWSGTVTSGDRSAQTLNAGLLLGLSLHF